MNSCDGFPPVEGRHWCEYNVSDKNCEKPAVKTNKNNKNKIESGHAGFSDIFANALFESFNILGKINDQS